MKTALFHRSIAKRIDKVRPTMLTRPAVLLRTEEAALLVAAGLLYAHFEFRWLLFAGLFLVPDLSMIGYLANPRIGATLYNLCHTLTLALILGAGGWLLHRPMCVAIALIWIAHIAFDRLLGYGLKYPGRFNDTHLQRIA